MMTRAPEHQSTRAPEFLVSFLFSLFLNLGLLFFLPYLGKATSVKVYKAYKINLVKLLEKKKVISQKPKSIVQKPREEQKPQPQEQQVFLPIEESPIVEKQEEVIPVAKEEPKEIPHIIVPVPQEEQRVYEQGSLDSPLKLISYIAPKYPVIAKEKEIEGIIKLRLLINPDGGVFSAEIIEENPKGFGFKEEALRVVNKYKFSPPTVSGKRVYVYYILPLRFSLED